MTLRASRLTALAVKRCRVLSNRQVLTAATFPNTKKGHPYGQPFLVFGGSCRMNHNSLRALVTLRASRLTALVVKRCRVLSNRQVFTAATFPNTKKGHPYGQPFLVFGGSCRMNHNSLRALVTLRASRLTALVVKRCRVLSNRQVLTAATFPNTKKGHPYGQPFLVFGGSCRMNHNSLRALVTLRASRLTALVVKRCRVLSNRQVLTAATFPNTKKGHPYGQPFLVFGGSCRMNHNSLRALVTLRASRLTALVVKRCRVLSNRQVLTAATFPNTKKGHPYGQPFLVFGGSCRIRTCDQLVKSQLLYQLS